MLEYYVILTIVISNLYEKNLGHFFIYFIFYAKYNYTVFNDNAEWYFFFIWSSLINFIILA